MGNTNLPNQSVKPSNLVTSEAESLDAKSADEMGTLFPVTSVVQLTLLFPKTTAVTPVNFTPTTLVSTKCYTVYKFYTSVLCSYYFYLYFYMFNVIFCPLFVPLLNVPCNFTPKPENSKYHHY